jgi:hypothetical protein
MMCTFFSKGSVDVMPMEVDSANNPGLAQTTEPSATIQCITDLVNYPSNLSSEEDSESSNSDDEENSEIEGKLSGHLLAVPPRKRKKLDVPYHVQREQKRTQ